MADREADWIGAVRLDPKIWGERAAEARAIARRIEDVESSKLLAQIAQLYDRLNERANDLLVRAEGKQRMILRGSVLERS